MQDLTCGRCSNHQHSVAMYYVNQFKVRGVDTHGYHCVRCNGKVHLQFFTGPDGKRAARQVQLVGNEEEWRPPSIRGGDQVQIQAAYSLGQRPGGNHHKLPQRVTAPQLLPPGSAYQLDTKQDPHALLPPGHPMHPEQIRRRTQPVSLEEFGVL